MKGNKIYLLLLFVFLVLVFVYQYFSPKEFVWNPTFSKYDKQPFGSYVFDDVMTTSMTDYQVENKTFYQLYQESGGTDDLEEEESEEMEEDDEIGEEDESYDLKVLQSYDLPTAARRAFLLTEDHIEFSAVDVKALMYLLDQGHTIMLCLNRFPRILCDSISFDYHYAGYYSAGSIARLAREGLQRDNLLLGIDSLQPENIYKVYPHLHPVYLEESTNIVLGNDSLEQKKELRCDWSEILVRNTDGQPVAIRLGKGQGELFLVATPLMFTNYGVLDGDNASYAFRLLSYMKDLPVTRIEAYNQLVNQASGSPLRYLLSQPPLRWALYISLITIVLCMIFTAKRRQQVIPVVHPPANETLRFTQLIGNLYYQRQDYKDMLQKKYLYFCTEVKQMSGLDLRSDDSDEELCRRLTDKMGLDFGDVWPSYRELKYLIREGTTVDETSMMRLVDKMNEWITNL